jgi:hypothetical protein
MTACAYLVMFCSDTGECALIPLRGEEQTITFNHIGAILGGRGKNVWIYRLPRHVWIDRTIPVQMKNKFVLSSFSTKHMIFCAFSTVGRALECLSLWQKTGGTQNLSAE